MKTISPDKLRGLVIVKGACLLILTAALLTNSLAAFACNGGNANKGQGGNQKGANAIVKLNEAVVIFNAAPASSPVIRSSILVKPATTTTQPAVPTVTITLKPTGSPATTTTQPAASPQMTTEEQILTTAQGFPLYYYDTDKDAKKPACNKATNQACTTAWPPLLQSNGESLTVAELPVKLVVVQNANGQQITYQGHPLYTYTQDKMPLIALGDKLGGGTWHVATPKTPQLPTLS